MMVSSRARRAPSWPGRTSTSAIFCDQLELAVDAALPFAEMQAVGGAGVDLGEVEVADELHRVHQALAERRGVEPELGELAHPHHLAAERGSRRGRLTCS
mgnify:CR=1 FL=1